MSKLSAFIPQSLPKIPFHRLPLPVRAKAIKLLPKILKPSFTLVPFALQRAILLPALQAIFQTEITEGDMDFLQNKWLRISITDLGLHWWLSINEHKLIMEKPNNNLTEDVSFSASGDDLLLIAGRKQDPDTLFFQRRLKIEGDTELGLEVKNLIDAIELEKIPGTIHHLVEQCAQLLEQTKQELALTAVNKNG